jgi:hypothetical protein
MFGWDRSPQFLQITLPLTYIMIRSSTEVAKKGLLVVIAVQITSDPVRRRRTVIDPGCSDQGKIMVPQDG